MQFRDDGYLPEALLNQLVRLGWSRGNQEIFSREEMVALFDIADVNRAPAAFDYDKLGWLNQHYIRQSDSERLGALLAEQFQRMGVDASGGAAPSLLADVQRDRTRTIAEMAEKSRFAFEEHDEFDERAAKKHLRPVALEPLEAVREKLHAVASWEPAPLHRAVTECAGGSVAEHREGGTTTSRRSDRHRRVARDRTHSADGRPGRGPFAHRPRHRLRAGTRAPTGVPAKPENADSIAMIGRSDHPNPREIG